MPDGSVPFIIYRKWVCWVDDCLILLDGDGAFRHWKYEGAIAEQPWIDIQIYKVIRKRWVELRNTDNASKFKGMQNKSATKSLKRR